MKAWRGSVGPQVIFALAAGLIASVIAALLTRPWAAGAVGFDSAASVLYFERITAGVRLEAFLGATPKPALTLLFGAVHAVTGDWRAIAALTVATYGLAIASGTLLVARVAGSAAAAFAFVMLLGARLLLEDVSLSYATPLGLWLLTIAGLALARPRPAYRVAAVALLLAPLTRFETIVLPMSAAIFVVVAWVVERRRPGAHPRASRFVPLLLGLLSIPIMLLHDLVLTGDPWYWLQVPARYSEIHPDSVRNAGEVIGALVQRYWRIAPLVALGAIGVSWAIRNRSTAVALGLIGTGLGTAALLVVLGARGTYVSNRYFALIDLSVFLAAAIGSGVVLGVLRRWLVAATGRRAVGRPAEVAAVAIACVLGFGLARPWSPLDTSTQRVIADQVQIAANAAAAMDAIAASRARPPCPVGDPATRVLLPGLWTPRAAVDLGLSLDQIDPLLVDGSGMPGAITEPGLYVVHDRRLDRNQPPMPGLEGAPIASRDVRLIALLEDDRAGIWVYQTCPRSG